MISGFLALLTPLGGMAGAVFILLTRRIKRLEDENKDLLGFAMTACAEKADGMEKLAAIIVKRSA